MPTSKGRQWAVTWIAFRICSSDAWPTMVPREGATAQLRVTSDNASIEGKATEEVHVGAAAWEQLARNIGKCLVASDLKRDSGFDGSSTGWTSWVDESSALRLQSYLDKLLFLEDSEWTLLEQDENFSDNAKQFLGENDRDDTVRWWKWAKGSPVPVVVECSESLRDAVTETLTPGDFEQISQTREDFQARIACRLFFFPSGTSLQQNLRTPAGAMVYGKALYGGVTRYRQLGSARSNTSRRKAGERTVIVSAAETSNGMPAPTMSWLQYGGPERNYDAVDMGPCALMELTVLPKGLSVPLLEDESDSDEIGSTEMKDMSIFRATVDPAQLFMTYRTSSQESPTTSTSNMGESHEIENRFRSKLGGLDAEIESIVRRVLDGRSLATISNERGFASEQKVLKMFGLEPVRGVLLHGPPGCGKTALARELSGVLTERPAKIVSAPELLDRWVGGSERLVRDLFKDAEEELALCNGDSSQSGLHIIIIDEIDAVFRRRSNGNDSGEVTRASAVNQILAKIDGVHELPNILVVGTTNRKELLDEALLRPGRLEVQVEVPLPDREGRREILKIHFDALRRRGRLSKPLCQAIDGPTRDENVSTMNAFQRSLSRHLLRFSGRRRRIGDLASDQWTGGFSGADLQGLVRCAGSIALTRARNDGNGIDGLLITLQDIQLALVELKK